ncbi:gag-pol polyprotein, partial [Trifolium medium]|nr:gag-pol polyprotein [Trifolium medium]
MDPKSDEGIFLGYFTNSRAYRVFNSRKKVIMESINVVVDDTTGDKTTDVADDDITSDLQDDLQDAEPVTVKEP